jgi:hypothetical protein
MLYLPIQAECSVGVNWNESAARVLAQRGQNGRHSFPRKLGSGTQWPRWFPQSSAGATKYKAPASFRFWPGLSLFSVECLYSPIRSGVVNGRPKAPRCNERLVRRRD